jgi:flavorubredoxin
MKSLVIYDSQYGNTRLLAEAIMQVLEEYGEVRLVRASDADPDIVTDVDLLVMGGPTIAHGLSAEMKNLLEAAESLAAPVSELHPSRPVALAFDTRINWPIWLSGSAADKIARVLTRMGCRMLADPASFIVASRDGPLAEGEKERAIAWIGMALQHLETAAAV